MEEELRPEGAGPGPRRGEGTAGENLTHHLHAEDAAGGAGTLELFLPSPRGAREAGM